MKNEIPLTIKTSNPMLDYDDYVMLYRHHYGNVNKCLSLWNFINKLKDGGKVRIKNKCQFIFGSN